MCREGCEMTLLAGPVFFAFFFFSPRVPPDVHLRPGWAVAGLARSSSGSESAILKFADNDLFRQGSL